MNQQLTNQELATTTDFWTTWALTDGEPPTTAAGKTLTAKESPTTQLPVLPVREAWQLPATREWQNRFTVKSETSNRLYVIAQHRERKHWGCSCPGYRRYRRCKHLEAIGLPTNETPFEAILES